MAHCPKIKFARDRLSKLLYMCGFSHDASVLPAAWLQSRSAGIVSIGRAEDKLGSRVYVPDPEYLGCGLRQGRERPNKRLLVTTFADQAVIAIENVRLFEEVPARTRELSEALEQQTATAEVLRVISSSPGDLEPVFQTMLANAVRICEGKFGVMFGFADGVFRALSSLAAPPPLTQQPHVVIEHPHNPLTRLAERRKNLVGVVSDDGVALTRYVFQRSPIDDLNETAAVTDQTGTLQQAGRDGHRGSADAEHLPEKLLRIASPSMQSCVCSSHRQSLASSTARRLRQIHGLHRSRGPHHRFIPDDRRTSAHVTDAPLCCFLGWRFWLCRKLEHRCLLTLAQIREENTGAIRKLERIVMHPRLVLVDLPKDRRPEVYRFCPPRGEAKGCGGAFHLLGKRKLCSRKNAHRRCRILRRSKPSSTRVEVDCPKLVPDLSRAGFNVVETEVTHGRGTPLMSRSPRLLIF